MTKVLRAVIVLVTLAGAACSKEGEPGSCYRANDNACIDYDRRQSAAGKRLCSGLDWTAGERRCPTAGRLGSCSTKSGCSASAM